MKKFAAQHTFNSTGLVAGRDAKQLINRPDQTNLHWRLGNTEQFFDEMKERLKLTTPDGELIPSYEDLRKVELSDNIQDQLKVVLSNLVTDPTTDWAAALMNAWAIIGDVLSFYQERLINEGYIGTATQPDSISFLNAMLGLNQSPIATQDIHNQAAYKFPGIAGYAEVIATVKGGKGMPGVSTIPANSPVRRVTPAGGPVCYFVTQKECEIRSEWNRLLPHKDTTQSALKIDTPYLPGPGQLFETALSKLKPSAFIEISGKDAENCDTWHLMKVISARVDQSAKQTTVIWKDIASANINTTHEQSASGITAPQFFDLSQSLPIFGHKASDLTKEPTDVRMQYIASGGIEEWHTPPKSKAVDKPDTVDEIAPVSLNDGLPAYAVQDFLVTENNTIYLATDNGVYFRVSKEKPWVAASQGLFRRSIITLAEDKQGFIYAGTISGGVYRSMSGSTSWSSLPGGYLMQPSKLKNGPSLRTSLPNTTVNKVVLSDHIIALTAHDEKMHPVPEGLVLAATNNGLYQNDQTGTGWLNIPLAPIPKTATVKNGSQPQSPAPVLDCILTAHHGKAYIVIATDSVLQVLEWPKKYKAAKAKPKQNPDAKATGHGPDHIPNIFIIAFDGILKLLKLAWLTLGKMLKVIWATLVKSYRAIVKFLTWLTDVDPQHWADTDLPYPGPKVPFTGKFISLQLGKVSSKKSKTEAFAALSTSTGIYAFNAKSGELSPWTNGLPIKSNEPFGALTHVADPKSHSNANMLTFYAGKIYGFVPTGGLNKNSIPAGAWQLLLDLPESKHLPANTPHYPSRAYARDNASFYVIRPIEFMTEWPNFEIGDAEGDISQIDVIGLKGKVTPNMVGVLIGDDNTHFTAFKINDSTSTTRHEFGLKSTVTRLKITPQSHSFDLQYYNRRTSKVLVGDKEMFAANTHVAKLTTVSGSSIEVDGLIPDLAEQRISITGAAARALVIPLGGIQKWAFVDGLSKQSGVPMLPLKSVTSLTATPEDLYIALTPEGVWQAGTDLSWQAANNGLDTDDKNTKQIVIMTDGTTRLLTTKNTYSRSSPTAPWQKQVKATCDKPLSVFFEATINEDTQGSVLLLGTSGDGLFQSKDSGVTWAKITWHGLPIDSYITAIAQTPKGDIFVGTDGDGLVCVDQSLSLWQKISVPTPLNRISLIRLNGSDLILSNMCGDIYQFVDDDKTHTLKGLSSTPGGQQILDLVIDEKEWTAGLKGGGVIQSQDRGAHWHSIVTGVNNQVQALLKYKDNWLIASKPETILTDYTVQQKVGLKKLFTTNTADMESQLDRQLVSNGLLDVFKQAKVKPPVHPYIQILKHSSSWLLSEQSTGKPASKSSSSFFIQKDSDTLIVSETGPELPVIAYTENNDHNVQHYSLALDDGGKAVVSSLPSQIIPRPALKGDISKSDINTVTDSQMKPAHNCTTLSLQAPIKRLLDSNTLSYSANIIPLAQGQLIKDEILGNGNPLIAFQSFSLKTGPLVFERKTSDIIEPILLVTVNGIKYNPISSFAEAGSNDKIYVLTVDDKGIATLTFGNGQTGELLVAGVGNVKATYRSDMLPFDAKDQEALYLFTEPPYGVSTINYPACQIAPEIEKPVHLNKKHASEAAFSPSRLVTYSDYEMLANGLNGVSKSKFELATVKNCKTINLTIAGDNPKPIEPDSPIIATTAAAIDRIGLAPKLPVNILPANMRPFTLTIQLTLETGINGDTTRQVLLETYEKLVDQFEFDNARIDANVYMINVLQIVKSSPLVADATIQYMHDAGKPPVKENLIVTRNTKNEAIGADLIYLNPLPDSVHITSVDSSGKTTSKARFPDAIPQAGGTT